MPVDDADTVLVCGFLGCDLRPFNPLVSALPHLLHLPAARAGGWMEHVIAQAARESAERCANPPSGARAPRRCWNGWRR